MISLLFILHATVILPRRAVASETHGAQLSVEIDHKYIYQSHVFHSKPQSVIDLVLSDVREVNEGSGGRTVLDIDASSSQLDDGAIISLVERLVPTVQETIRGDVKRKVLIKLALGMNRLTPSGASKLFDSLSNSGVNAENNGNETSTNDNVHLSDNTIDDQSVECAGALPDVSVALNNQTTLSSPSNTTHNASIQLPHDGEDLDTNQVQTSEPIIELEELDLSFSDIGGHGTQFIGLDLVNSARRLFERGLNCHSTNDPLLVPRVLAMENCGIGPAFCRSIGRGILNAFENRRHSKHSYRPSVLRIGGNHAVGDQGAVAIAAALRLAVQNLDSEVDLENDHLTQHRGLEELDLSSCNVGDTGAESLALALAFNPCCLSKLDLSNNQITDVGAKTIGRALVEAHRVKVLRRGIPGYVLEEIVLDNNVQIGDGGAVALAEAIACGAIRSISLRSCSVKAEGAAAFGKAISSLTKEKCGLHDDSINLHVDLSGNAFGIKPAKKKKGAAYSAGLLRDKASSHISYIGKTLQKGWKEGLKGAGVSMGLTVDSDDDEENLSIMGGLINTEDDREDEQLFEASARCGARSFSAEILKGKNDGQGVSKEYTGQLSVYVAMRRCSLDDGATDALSAAVTEMMKNPGTNLVIDVSMNSVGPQTVTALLRDKNEEKLLISMAKRHMNALAVMNEARERAALAAESAVARADMEKKFGGFLHEDGPDFEFDEYDDD
ncbi:hypothetical protein HJC23_009384 [Cyclotella cryptica]|uniref:Uncharacterized protein n=1 Tax=Cyclotella cryptica TaxID=29204 RepID=A0ABD3PY68_9STRA|eukprot:CCRYP_010567-RA/>CCRYP_010567-RA protein AED:0.05 eAED:0.04 QI:0/0/0/1/1/1/2/0/724